MSNKKYLDYAGLKRCLAKLLPGNRKIWHGSWEDWESLSAAEKAKYDQAELVGEFNYEQFQVDKVVDNTEYPVTSDAVDKTYNESLGQVITSAFFSGTVNNWRNNISVTINNVPKGKYLIFGAVYNNSVGILTINASVSSGVIRTMQGVSNSSKTGDTYLNQDVVGFYEQTEDGNKNVTFSCDVYSNNSSNVTKAQLLLMRID